MNTNTVNDFFICLAESETDAVDTKIREILKSHFKLNNDSTILKNSTDKPDKGIDYSIEKSGSLIHIDIKVRKRSSKDADVALELMSNIELGKEGWLNGDKLTDYILWLWEDGVWKIYPYKELVIIFAAKKDVWQEKYFCPKQFTRVNGQGYHSSCVFVPIKEIERQLFNLAIGDL